LAEEFLDAGHGISRAVFNRFKPALQAVAPIQTRQPALGNAIPPAGRRNRFTRAGS
jgi:hypothetical protein